MFNITPIGTALLLDDQAITDWDFDLLGGGDAGASSAQKSPVQRPVEETNQAEGPVSSEPTPIAGEFRVNTYTDNAQSFSSVTALDGGGFVVTWSSYGQDGSSLGIYGQRYTAAGVADGGEFQINTATLSDQVYSSAAALIGGGFVVTWSSLNQDGNSWGIYGQRYTAAGTMDGSEFLVNTFIFSEQLYSSVATLNSGGFVVTWTSASQDSSGYGIYAQRYTAAGVPDGAEFRVNTFTANDQLFSSISALSNGGFVVTWTSENQDSSGYGVYGQRYTAVGVADGGEFRVNSFISSSQAYSSVAALDGGGFVVTWSSFIQDDSGYGIYAQRYDAAGAAAGGEFLVNSFTTSDQFFSSVAALNDGGFLVTWSSDNQDGSSYGIYGQRYTAAGVADGAEFRVSETTAGSQFQDAIPLQGVTQLADGSLVATWFGEGTGDADGVFARRFSLGSVNAAPAGTDATLTITEDTARVLTVTDFGFTDADGNALLSVGITTLPNAGSITLNGTAITAGIFVTAADINAGLLVYTPGSNGNGTGYSSFTFQVRDNGGDTDTDLSANTITFDVTALNDAPVIANLQGDSVNMTEGVTSTQISLDAGLNAVITDPDSGNFNGGSLSFAITDGLVASRDRLVIVGNGTVSLSSQNIGSVVSVNGFAIGTISAFNASTNTQTVTFTTDDATAARVQLLIRAVQYVGDPQDPVSGTRTVSWTLVDGDGGADTTTVTSSIVVIGVNDAPTGTDSARTITEDQPVALTIANFGFDNHATSTTNENQSLQAVIITTVPTAGALYIDIDGAGTGSIGTLVTAGQSVSAADITAGRLVYVPAANANGSAAAAFTFQVQDNGGTANGGQDTDISANTLTFNVTAVNDAPVISAPGVQSVNEDGSFTLSIGNGNAINVSDVEATTLTVTLSVSHGALTFASTAGLSFSVGDGTDDTTITFSGSPAAINAALGAGVTYRPDANFNGSDAIAISTSDNGQSGGPVQTDADTVAITVNSVNDAPQGADTNLTGSEDDPLVFTAADFGFSDPVDDNGFAGIYIDSFPTNGTLFLDGDGPGGDAPIDLSSYGPGVFISGNVISSGLLYFQPTADEYGTGYASFTFRVRDDGGTANGGVDQSLFANTITIDIVADNVAPVLDLNGGAAGLNNSVSYTEQFGATRLTNALVLSDVDSATLTGATVQITGGFVPLAGDGADYLGISGSGSGYIVGINYDYNALTGILTLSGNASVADYRFMLAQVTFQSTTNNPGTSRTVTWTVNDGSATSAPVTTTIAVTPVDDAPAAVADSATVAENATVIINVTGNDTDIDAGPRFVIQINGTPAGIGTAITLASGATATNNGNGTITYNPNGRFNTLPATDSGASNTSAADSFSYGLFGGSSALVTVTVTGIDSNDTLIGTAGNDFLNGGVGNDIITGGGSGDTLTGGTDNDTFVYQNLTDSNSLERDGIQDFALGDIIDVTAIDANTNVAGNQDFLFVGTSAFTSTAGELRYENISAGGPIYLVQGDVDGDGVSDFEVVLVNTENRAFTRADFAGVITNFAPVAVDDALAATEDTAITYTAAQLTGNDTDADNNPLYISSVTAVSGGTVVLNGDGTVTFTPDANFNGDAVFDYTTADGSGGTDVGRVTVAVSAVNDAPVVGLAFNAPVIDQSALDLSSGHNISAFVQANNFTVSGPTTLNQFTVFLAESSVATAGTFEGFGGTLSFAIYRDNGSGLPGTLITTGADLAPVAADTGLDLGGRDLFQFVVNVGGISLTSGDYWIALHEGAWLSPSDGTDIFWSRSANDVNNNLRANTSNVTAPNGTFATFSPGLAFSLSGSSAATEQVSYNLKGRVTVSDVDAGSFIVTATLSVGYGILKVTAGTSGAAVVSGQGTDTVVLSGTIAQLNALLSSDATSTVRYIANTDTPPASTNLTVSVNDNGSFGSGGAQIGSATQVITIAAVNDAPVVDLNGAAAGIDTTASYTEGATPIRPLLGMTITDVDSGTLSGATVTIGTGFVAGDLLRLAGGFNGTTGSGITYSYNSGTGVLTLSGVASLADYQSALAALSFKSNSDDPGTARDITVVVNDGSANSVAAHIVVAVSPVNDAPVNAVPTGQATTSGANIVFSAANGNALSISDPDAGTGMIRVRLSAEHGIITLASTAGVTVTGDGTGIVKITGSLTAINAALEGLTYQNTAGYTGADALTITTNDTGNTGSGGPLTDTDSVTITVDPAVVQAVLADTLYANDQSSDLSAAFVANDNDNGVGYGGLDNTIVLTHSGPDSILGLIFIV